MGDGSTSNRDRYDDRQDDRSPTSGSGSDTNSSADDDPAAEAQAAVDDYAAAAGVDSADSNSDGDDSGNAGDGAAGEGANAEQDQSPGNAAVGGAGGGSESGSSDAAAGRASGTAPGNASMTGQYAVVNDPVDETADEVEAFATDTFADGAVADRFRDPEDARAVTDGLEDPLEGPLAVRAAPAAEHRPNRFGGWDDFDQGNILRRDPLLNTGEGAGVTADHMFKANLSGEASDSYHAYITDYNNRHLDFQKGHAQMSTFAALDAMGLRVPAHTYDANEDLVAAASVEKVGRSEIKLVSELRSRDIPSDEAATFAENINTEELTDILAANVLVGNDDLHTQNIKVGRDGSIYCFDFDHGGNSYYNFSMLEDCCHGPAYTAGQLDAVARSGTNVDVTEDEIAARAAEIAYEIEEADRKEAVVERVRQYDRLFHDRTGATYAENIKNNIEVAAEQHRTS